jgi:hypothetical protein
MTIAVLYCDPQGVYAGLPGLDLWGEERDARLYSGPYPVIAHPLCSRWGRYAEWYGQKKGDDAGCFAAALASVRRWGGVIEHPAGSAAWSAFRLPLPAIGGGLAWIAV